MKRFTLMASATVAAVVPAAAAAKPPSSIHVRAYEREYQRVVHVLGRRAPGRNIVKFGVSARGPATDADVLSSLAVLGRMLAPPPTVATTASQTAGATQSVASVPASNAAGASGVPACASESGTNYSTGPDNTNASSGATGRYQIIPSTAANFGCNLSTPAGQDACAQTIYNHQGASAWVGCGG
jgi:Transglycosylase-like domain